MLRNILVVLFVTLGLVFSYAQNVKIIDSLVITYGQAKEPTTQFDVLNQLCRYTQRSFPEDGLRYAMMYDSIAQSINDPFRMGRAATLIGTSYYGQAKYVEATTSFLSALDHYILSGDSTMIGSSYTNLSAIAWARKDTNACISYLEQAHELYLIKKQPHRLAISSTNIGFMYMEKGEDDVAKKYLNDAIIYFKEAKREDRISQPLLRLAKINSRNEAYPEAVQNVTEALRVMDQMRNADAAAEAYVSRASIYLKLRQIGKAHSDILKAESLVKENSLAQVKPSLYNLWHDYYRATKNYKLAYDYYKLNVEAQDSILNIEKETEIEEILQKYENDKKTQEIQLLNTENALAYSELSASKKQTIGLLLGLLLISGLLFSLYRLYKRTVNQNEVISKALSEKEILLREIHHRVKNNLQFISSLLKLQTDHVEDSLALAALQEGQDRVQSMALIHQNLYQEENLTGVRMKEYFGKLIRGLFDSYNIRKDQIQLKLDVQDLNIDVDSVIPIGLIVNELVSNCLKYAFDKDSPGTITVSLKEINDHLHVEVADNGKGIDEQSQKSLGQGFGYKLIHVFAEQLDAEMSITNDHGTTVSLVISDYNMAHEQTSVKS